MKFYLPNRYLIQEFSDLTTVFAKSQFQYSTTLLFVERHYILSASKIYELTADHFYPAFFRLSSEEMLKRRTKALLLAINETVFTTMNRNGGKMFKIPALLSTIVELDDKRRLFEKWESYKRLYIP